MSANDPDDFIRRETDWLAVPLKEGDDRVYVNLFAPKDRSAPSQKTPGDLDPNDEIPF